MSAVARRLAAKPALFICDIQEKFRPAIHNFAAVVSTSQRLLKYSRTLSLPVYVTTQSASKLGATDPDLDISHAVGVWDKTRFSMALPEILADLRKRGIQDVAICGIESHICVLQTVLDLRNEGFGVWVIRDAVSSCNKQEIGTAIERMRSVGARVTTSESWVYEVMEDAAGKEFKEIAKVVKEEKENTKRGLQALL